MTKDDIIRKLCSRKLWLAVCAFIAMLIVALGGTENEAAQVAALVMAGATVIAYIIGEGLVDASEDSGEESDGSTYEDYYGATVTNNYSITQRTETDDNKEE